MGKWALALVLLLVGLAWWLLRDDAASVDGGPGALTSRAGGEAGEPALPRAERREAAPAALDVPDELAAPESTPPAASWRDTVDVLRASGRVVDLAGRAVPHAQVLLLPDRRTQLKLELAVEFSVDFEDLLALRPEDLASTHADDDGRFTLEGPWLRNLEPRSTSFEYGAPTLLVRADGFAVHAFELAQFTGAPLDVGELVLGHPAGSLRARFVDEQGAPVAGAFVDVGMATYIEEDMSALPPQGAPFFRVDSDADGVWHITQQWRGDFAMRVLSEGFEELSFRAELAAGEHRDLGEFTLRAAASVSGLVRDTRGAPVAGARVTAADSDYGQWMPDPNVSDADFLMASFPFQIREGVVSDAEGRFQLRGLPRDRAPYRVVAAADGYESAWLGGVAPDSSGLVLTLADEARVEVSAFDAVSGAEITDFELAAFRDINRWLPLTTPNMKQFLRLPTSGHRVHQAGPVGTRLFLAAPGYTREPHDVRGLQPGEVHHERVPLRPARALRLSCVDAEGAPVLDASVRLTPPAAWGSGARRGSDALLVRGRTDAEGLLVLEGLAAGTWELRVSADGFNALTDSAFEIADADAERTLRLARSSLLAGTLFGADGAPAPSQRVYWSDGRNRRDDQLTGPDGGFRMEHVMGAGSLHAARVPVLELEIATGETRELELHQRGPGVVTGRVIDAAGAPLENALVQLEGPTSLGYGPDRLNHVTRLDGRFEFTLELPGSYRLRVFHDGTERVEQLEVALDTRLEHDVAFGGASLSGVVVTEGTQLDASRISVTLDLGDERVGREHPGPDGRFSFTQLAPGSYFVGSYGGGSLTERWGPFELEAREELTGVELRPSPAAQLYGYATHADGGPFEGFVHLRCADDEHYEVSWLRFGDGLFDQRGLHPGVWRVDLAEQSAKLLGAGFGDTAGAGEPGVELPFFAGQQVELTAGERRRLDLRVADGARR